MANQDCGIYAIFNLTNGKTYIGSSKTLSRRIATHWKAIHHGRYGKPNQHPALERAYRKYGPKSWGIAILENCRPNDLAAREQWHAIEFRAFLHGYNCATIQRGGPMSAETLEKIRASSHEVWSRPDFQEKIRQTLAQPEYRERISANSRSVWARPEFRRKRARKPD